MAAGTEGDYVILTDGVKRQNPRAGAEGQPYSADYSTIVQMETGKTRLTGEGRVSQMCDASHAIHDASMPGAIACKQGAWLPGDQAPENTCDNHAGHSGVEADVWPALMSKVKRPSNSCCRFAMNPSSAMPRYWLSFCSGQSAANMPDSSATYASMYATTATVNVETHSCRTQHFTLGAPNV